MLSKIGLTSKANNRVHNSHSYPLFSNSAKSRCMFNVTLSKSKDASPYHLPLQASAVPLFRSKYKRVTRLLLPLLFFGVFARFCFSHQASLVGYTRRQEFSRLRYKCRDNRSCCTSSQ